MADAFLDALGDGDLALAGEQFHGSHLAHVHAHRIRRPTSFRLHCGQCRGSLLRGDLVRGVVASVQQFVGVGSGLRRLVDGDSHIVDHADDVFDLVGIADVVGQVVVDLGVGQESLLLALGDQFLEARLVLFGFGSSHITSCGGRGLRECGGQKPAIQGQKSGAS